MAGIAGVVAVGQAASVNNMLSAVSHRGGDGTKLISHGDISLAATWSNSLQSPVSPELSRTQVWDANQPPIYDTISADRDFGPFAVAAATEKGIFLARDRLGIKPLYYGYRGDGVLCFASEVKALIRETRDVHEFPPGFYFTQLSGFQPFALVESLPVYMQEPDQIAHGLRIRLEQAVCQNLALDMAGCWLSGGLDSSIIAAMLRPHVTKLYTFSGGLRDAPDLKFAHQVAEYLGSEHREIVIDLQLLVKILSDVIYSLESFDALLVRSTLINKLVAEQAANYVSSVFSGEGSDELFAGYDYLRNINQHDLQAELIDITCQLHNTALQRVDRSASAHGLIAFLPFLDQDVVDYAIQIPPQLKIYRQEKVISKWILRRASIGLLPEHILWRPKAKFWQGAGVKDLLLEYANQTITDRDFRRERLLPNGWLLHTKEELLFYRCFRDHFGDLTDLSWMGVTHPYAC